jgi:DNA-binding NtrC family response regulator
MILISILLLEDDKELAKSFIRNFGSESVNITVVESVTAAIQALNNNTYDLTVIDPMMGNTINFPSFLEAISTKETEIKIVHPGNFLPDWIKNPSEKKNLEVISLNDNSALFRIITDLVKQKSSPGSNAREIQKDQHTLEVRIVKIEMQLDNFNNQLTTLFSEIKKISNSELEILLKNKEEKNKAVIAWIGVVGALILATSTFLSSPTIHDFLLHPSEKTK